MRSFHSDREQAQEFCNATNHKWLEEYYGYVCENCGLFIPYGSAPWMPFDPDDCPEVYYFEWDDEA
jgi:hypothetical protein